MNDVHVDVPHGVHVCGRPDAGACVPHGGDVPPYVHVYVHACHDVHVYVRHDVGDYVDPYVRAYAHHDAHVCVADYACDCDDFHVHVYVGGHVCVPLYVRAHAPAYGRDCGSAYVGDSAPLQLFVWSPRGQGIRICLMLELFCGNYRFVLFPLDGAPQN